MSKPPHHAPSPRPLTTPPHHAPSPRPLTTPPHHAPSPRPSPLPSPLVFFLIPKRTWLQKDVTLVIPDSCWMMIWVFLAIRALNGVGRARASSNELVCSDWVPPNTAAIASMQVRMMLLYGSYAYRHTHTHTHTHTHSQKWLLSMTINFRRKRYKLTMDCRQFVMQLRLDYM